LDEQQINIESHWIKKIHDGDELSFESLFNAYCQKLINFSRRYVYDKQIAENIVQDIFVKIWINRKSLDHSKSIKTYLFTAVKNNSLKHLRHVNVEKRHILITIDSNEEINHAIKFEINEIAERLNQEINNLPPKCQEIFSMSKFDKLKYGEIAEILDISVKTVETQMGRALKKLRKNLRHLLMLVICLIAGIFNDF
jgi:RNA polymerase sigma-19 factor, ECF subfamily